MRRYVLIIVVLRRHLSFLSTYITIINYFAYVYTYTCYRFVFVNVTRYRICFLFYQNPGLFLLNVIFKISATIIKHGAITHIQCNSLTSYVNMCYLHWIDWNTCFFQSYTSTKNKSQTCSTLTFIMNQLTRNTVSHLTLKNAVPTGRSIHFQDICKCSRHCSWITLLMGSCVS